LTSSTGDHNTRNHSYESGTPDCATEYLPDCPVAWPDAI
jgi:hypothetical protein